MIVNFLHEFYAKCNRTVVILRVCLFCSPHGNDKMILNGRNDAGGIHDCSCFSLEYGNGRTATRHSHFTL